jgi:hypothetical protein
MNDYIFYDCNQIILDLRNYFIDFKIVLMNDYIFYDCNQMI